MHYTSPRAGIEAPSCGNHYSTANRATSAAEHKVPPDRKTQDRLLAEVDAAAERVAREEDEFTRFLTDSLSEEQLEELRARTE